MVLIMSDEKDISTIHVIEWLLHWRIPFFRINREDRIELEAISIANNAEIQISLVKNGQHRISLEDIRVCWYRRGQLSITYPTQLPNEIEESVKVALATNMYAELDSIIEYIYFYLDCLPHIGTFKTRRINKIIALHKASQLGLDVPKTLITPSKSIYRCFFDKVPTITKAIRDSIEVKVNNQSFAAYTEMISLSQLQNQFFPSKFQSMIEKEADLRIFYLLGKFFSMAILSQKNKRTSVDFRKYDFNNPNRCFPFQLPILLQEKLIQLMNELGLESGSIDMILTKSGRYVFLEVNPVGQFNMVSLPCNYYLEREIALHLSSYVKNQNTWKSF